MTPKFSLAHLTLLDCDPAELTYIAARAGYDYVSFRPISLETPGEKAYDLAHDAELMRRTKHALTDTGLSLLDIELARIYDRVDPKIYVPAMEAAAELGGKHLLTSGWTSDQDFLMDCYAELCDLAQPLGLTVDFEFVAWANVSTLSETVHIVQQVDRPNAGIMIDTLHAYASNMPSEALSLIPSGLFHYAQVCDAPRGTLTTPELQQIGREARLYPGTGAIDIGEILRYVPLVPYSLEIPNRQQAKELGHERFARQCLDTTKAYLNVHPGPWK